MKPRRKSAAQQKISKNRRILKTLKFIIEADPEEPPGEPSGRFPERREIPRPIEIVEPIYRNTFTEKFLNDNMLDAMRKLYQLQCKMQPNAQEHILDLEPTIKIYHRKTLKSKRKKSNSAKNERQPKEKHREYHATSKSTCSISSISVSKWNISVTSVDCVIERRKPGWQISTKSEATVAEESKLSAYFQKYVTMDTGTDSAPVETANAEINCNRDEEKEDEEENDNDFCYSGFSLTQYVKLLNKENARINFVLNVLTKAVNEHKIFVVTGFFPVVRLPLTRRGWLEKRTIRRLIAMPPDMNESYGLEPIEKLLRTPPDFVWYANKKSTTIKSGDETIVNKLVGCYFTSKIDMCSNLETTYWFYERGVSNVQFPRCYNASQLAQVEEFVQDFYMTACMGVLKWFMFLAGIAGAGSIHGRTGTVPINVVFFAIERCSEYISVRAHEDLDRDVLKSVPSSDWNEFLNWHRKILYEREVLRETDATQINDLLKYMAVTLKKMTEYRPQSSLDGMRNVWILKPGDKSLGRGIILKNALSDILSKINHAAKENSQFVVQKYIERPLLVYKTKIDIRQWFLITRTHPLVVWMYKDVLIRFASRDFTLDNFHESIHLCNTTVQSRYRNLSKANEKLPRELHWNLEDFQQHLKETNRESAWDKVIKPGIKENLIGALLASQDNMANRKNSFQLYGADFVIMDDLSVWLIEINTNPRFHPPSSSVTEALYPEVIEDTMKVVLDRQKNRVTDFGKFECIYKQRNPFSGNSLGQGANLSIRGKALIINTRK